MIRRIELLLAVVLLSVCASLAAKPAPKLVHWMDYSAALKKAKDATQAEMQKMMQAGGAGGLFGK
jgi:type II secretory pathway pseudopilin PulG